MTARRRHAIITVMPDAAVPPELAAHPRYRVERELGRGAMGVVYLAHNTALDRPEVVKVIARELLARPDARDRFLREIRTAAQLSHPNVVTAYAAIAEGDFLALTMEYVRGETLDAVLARGRLPVQHAAFYAAQAAMGLQHAHEKGMVHRDIKPSNLMAATVGKKTVVKVLDFGLGKATSEKADEGLLTKSGAMLGTPRYVAPEQARDAATADIRADVYGLGCTLFHLLAGTPPFTAPTLMGLLYAHQHTLPPDVRSVRPEVPGGLAAVILRMMAKNPADRYQTPGEVVAALAPFARAGASKAADPLDDAETVLPQAEGAKTFDGLDETVREPKSVVPSRRLPGVVWLLVGLVVAAGGMAVLFALTRTPPPPTGPREVVVVPTARTTPPPTVRKEEPPPPPTTGKKEETPERTSPAARPTDLPLEAGFTRLFDGTSLADWETHPDHLGHWRLENGKMVGGTDGDEASALYTKRADFADVRVRARMRILSGVVRVYARSGFGPSPDGANPNLPEGWAAAFRQRDPVMVAAVGPRGATALTSSALKAGDWFTAEVEAVGGLCVVRVNGVEARRMTAGADRVRTGRIAVHHQLRGRVEVSAIDVKKVDGPAPPPAPAAPAQLPPVPPVTVLPGWKVVELPQADCLAGKVKLPPLPDELWIQLPDMPWPTGLEVGPKFNHPFETNRAFTVTGTSSAEDGIDAWGMSIGDDRGRVAVMFTNVGTWVYGPWVGNARLKPMAGLPRSPVGGKHPAIRPGQKGNAMTLVRRPTHLEVYANGVAVTPAIRLPEKLGTGLWVEWQVPPNGVHPWYEDLWLYDVGRFETPFYRK